MSCASCPWRRNLDKIPPSPFPNKPIDIMIIGEGPGTVEIQQQKPFVGPSGELLKQTLMQLQAQHLSYYITNAILCSCAGDFTEAVFACRSRVDNEIITVQPKVILALGAAALLSVRGEKKDKISKFQGQYEIIPDYGNVVYSYHPAAVLRNPSLYKDFKMAIEKTVAIAKGPQFKGVEKPALTKYAIAEEHNLSSILEKLSSYKYLALDLETAGLTYEKEVLCLGVSWKPGVAMIFPQELLDDYRLAEFLENPFTRFIWHNGKFDIKFLRHRRMRIDARCDDDTMLMHYAINELRGTHALDSLAKQYLNADDYDISSLVDKELGYKPLYEENPNVLFQYLAQDCDYTLQLYHIFAKELKL